MRVIAGSIKGRHLQGPEIGNLSIRPTADRAKEAIFSILQQYNTVGPFLDLFSGTGSIAIEAWSRGYRPVTCVEKQSSALTYIKNNARATEIKIVKDDIRFLPKDYFINQAVVFADPPYESSIELWIATASIIRNWLVPSNGILVWETAKNVILPHNENFALIETRCYGNNAFHIFSTL